MRFQKIGNRILMLPPCFVRHNVCRMRKSLRMSPAMAAGVSDTLYDMEWIVGPIDARPPKPNWPKTHRKLQIPN